MGKALKKGPQPFAVGDMVCISSEAVNSMVEGLDKELQFYKESDRLKFSSEYSRSLLAKIAALKKITPKTFYKVVLPAWKTALVEVNGVELVIPTKGLKLAEKT